MPSIGGVARLLRLRSPGVALDGATGHGELLSPDRGPTSPDSRPLPLSRSALRRRKISSGSMLDPDTTQCRDSQVSESILSGRRKARTHSHNVLRMGSEAATGLGKGKPRGS
jgi:hypothetical protein